MLESSKQTGFLAFMKTLKNSTASNVDERAPDTGKSQKKTGGNPGGDEASDGPTSSSSSVEASSSFQVFEQGKTLSAMNWQVLLSSSKPDQLKLLHYINPLLCAALTPVFTFII